MFRRRTEELAYRRVQKHNGCPFCNFKNPELHPRPRRIIQETDSMLIVGNMFPYHYWEGVDVAEHLLLIPKRHVTTMANLSANERHSMIDLLCQYESNGYSAYTRAHNAGTRSLPHVHTHLFKFPANAQPANFVMSLRKPYIFLKF